MSKEFWIAIGLISLCYMTAMFTKMLIGYEKPSHEIKIHDTSFEKRILILETKMAILLQERQENLK